jgi:hypothetical protein
MVSTRMRDGLSGGGRCLDACREVTGLIARDQEGDLALSEWLRLRSHLTGCPGCSDYRRQLQLTVKTLAELPIPDPSPATKRFLLQQFQNHRESRL